MISDTSNTYGAYSPEREPFSPQSAQEPDDRTIEYLKGRAEIAGALRQMCGRKVTLSDGQVTLAEIALVRINTLRELGLEYNLGDIHPDPKVADALLYLLPNLAGPRANGYNAQAPSRALQNTRYQ